VKIGDETVGLDLHEVARRIQSECPVRVTLTLSATKLKISVTERETLYIEYGDRYFSLSRELEVLDVSDTEEAFVGLIRAKLPAIEGLTVGQQVVFCNREIDRGYVSDMLDWLGEKAISERVELLDVSEKYNVSYVLDGTHRIVVGRVSDLAVKHRLAEEIMELRQGDSPCAVVDVSDLQRSTYRPLESVELLKA
jgi:hypothetical protein